MMLFLTFHSEEESINPKPWTLNPRHSHSRRMRHSSQFMWLYLAGNLHSVNYFSHIIDTATLCIHANECIAHPQIWLQISWCFSKISYKPSSPTPKSPNLLHSHMMDSGYMLTYVVASGTHDMPGWSDLCIWRKSSYASRPHPCCASPPIMVFHVITLRSSFLSKTSLASSILPHFAYAWPSALLTRKFDSSLDDSKTWLWTSIFNPWENNRRHNSTSSSTCSNDAHISDCIWFDQAFLIHLEKR